MGFKRASKEIHSYGIFALLRPNGKFVWSAGANRRYKGDDKKSSARPFKMMEWTKYGKKIVVGISNPDCMRDSWFDAYKYRVKLMTEEEEEESETEEVAQPLIACALDKKTYEIIFDEPAPWTSNNLCIISVPIWMVQEFELTPVSTPAPVTTKSKATPIKVLKPTTKVEVLN